MAERERKASDDGSSAIPPRSAIHTISITREVTLWQVWLDLANCVAGKTATH